MFYKDNIGLESIEREYKVFNFNPLKVSIEDGIKYLSSGIFYFNESVDETIFNYLQIYLPKYLCSFYNPLSNLKKSELYFGIDDDGKVIGIPYQGILEENFINLQIDKILSSHIKFPSNDIKNMIRKSIQIEIIPVNKSRENDKIIKKSTYSKYKNELNKINKQNNIYKKKRDIWNKMCDLKNSKLYDMINDESTRKYIWEYIKIISKYRKKRFKNKYSHLEPYCDIKNYWDLMSEIKSNYKFPPLKIGTMCKNSDDYLDIYKWIAIWKDSKFSMLKKVKPKKPIKKIDSYYPIFLLSQIPRMIPEWIKKNPNLNLYVIKITFYTDGCWQKLIYKDIENRWKSSYRTIIDGEPMSPSQYI